jgi:mycothiol synthase
VKDTPPHAAVPGLALRPYAGEQDLPAIAALFNAEWEADGVPEHRTVEDLRARYAHPSDHFDARRDVVLAEVDGAPVAVASSQWIDTTDGKLREHWLSGAVHPDWRRRGIGSVLFAENERRQRKLAASHETNRPRAIGLFVGEGQVGARVLATACGYRPVRYFFDMVRPLRDDIPDVPLPDGLEIKPITPDRLQQLWDADVEAFQDHWGGFDASPAAFRRWVESPDFDPSLYVIAFDGDEVAGGCVNGISPEENAALGVKRGWLNQVFTRRQWRRRGVARATIARSLVLYRERGLDEAALGVDAENPLGAFGLYESLGFGVTDRFTALRKPLTLGGDEAHHAHPTEASDDRDE